VASTERSEARDTASAAEGGARGDSGAEQGHAAAGGSGPGGEGSDAQAGGPGADAERSGEEPATSEDGQEIPPAVDSRENSGGRDESRDAADAGEVQDAEEVRDVDKTGDTEKSGDAERSRDAEGSAHAGEEGEEAALEHPGTEERDQRDTDAAVEADRADEAGGGDEPVLPPVAAVELSVLLDEYSGRDTGRRPWNWSALPPGHREALVELIDRFVDSYNQIWAMSDDQLIPPCWHRHPALAYDLAALVWTFHGAYRDSAASPEAALRFQGHLVSFADRLDRWLGRSAQECRDGRHQRNWRSVRSRGLRPDRDSLEYADEMALLGAEHFGFEEQTPAPSPEHPRADATR
jgi:hypothetical protein